MKKTSLIIGIVIGVLLTTGILFASVKLYSTTTNELGLQLKNTAIAENSTGDNTVDILTLFGLYTQLNNSYNQHLINQQIQIQNLQNQTTNLQTQYTTLQTQYATLQNQYNTLQQDYNNFKIQTEQRLQALEHQEQESIVFESNVLKIVNSSFILEKDSSGMIKQAELIVYFKNLLDVPIYNLALAINFCDKNNNILYSHPYTYISPFPAGYTEGSPNTFVYSEPNVVFVNHVNIQITGYTT